jgi:uncharacterized membrane protein
MNRVLKVFVYLAALLFSILFIYYGNQYFNNKASENGILYDREEELDTLVFAKIISIDEKLKDQLGESQKEICFTAKIIRDKEKVDQVIHGKQILKSEDKNMTDVSVGDKVVLLSYGDDQYLFQYYYRFEQVIVLGLILMLGILLMGGIKGVNTIISLALTCLSIFFLFIPSIQAGFNIYISTVIICIYIIVITLIIIYGLSEKSITAALGCITGVVFSGILSIFMNSWMKLTGYLNDDMYLLSNLFGIQVDVKAILFSMITIGALGAIMDVSISITSSLCELKENNQTMSPGALVASGFSIGRDIMGTMANTLILAYIGSSLVVVLLYAASNYPLLSLINKEEIIFEFLQSLIGSLSLIITIPFTSFVASIILSRKSQRNCHNAKHYERLRY